MYCHVAVGHRKVHTVSLAKNERLINLLIFLLTARRDRFWKKSEIFQRVLGYADDDSNAIAMDRKFERDKVELRKLGVVIEVQEVDPLFEDEVGYRVSPENYSKKIEKLSPDEIALLALAGKAWSELVASDDVQSALLRLASIDESTNITSIALNTSLVMTDHSNFAVIADALAQRSNIEFRYTNQDLTLSLRKVSPFALLARLGHWYLIAQDLDLAAKRTFRLDRIASLPKVIGSPHSFEVPEDVKADSYFAHEESVGTTVILKCVKGRAQSFHAIAEEIESSEEFDFLHILVTEPLELLEQILWHGNDVTVVEPIELRDQVMKTMKELVLRYG